MIKDELINKIEELKNACKLNSITAYDLGCLLEEILTFSDVQANTDIINNEINRAINCEEQLAYNVDLIDKKKAELVKLRGFNVPSTASGILNGELTYNTYEKKLYVYAAAYWGTYGTPEAGKFYYNTMDSTLYIWKGEDLVPILTENDIEVLFNELSNKTNSLRSDLTTISDNLDSVIQTARQTEDKVDRLEQENPIIILKGFNIPSSASGMVNGDRYYDTNNKKLFIFAAGQWGKDGTPEVGKFYYNKMDSTLYIWEGGELTPLLTENNLVQTGDVVLEDKSTVSIKKYLDEGKSGAIGIVVDPIKRTFIRPYLIDRACYGYNITLPHINNPDDGKKIIDYVFDVWHSQTGWYIGGYFPAFYYIRSYSKSDFPGVSPTNYIASIEECRAVIYSPQVKSGLKQIFDFNLTSEFTSSTEHPNSKVFYYMDRGDSGTLSKDLGMKNYVFDIY